MSETLEGRVKWVKLDRGIRIAIPARGGPFVSFYGTLVTIWLVLATLRSLRLLEGPRPMESEFILQMTAVSIYFIGASYFVGWLTWTLTGETRVTLTKPVLRIEIRVLGVAVSARTFDSDRIYHMRFIPAREFITRRAVLNPNTSCIRFDMDRKPHSFAKGVTVDEARAMIDRMLLT